MAYINQEITSVIKEIKGELPNCPTYLSSVIHQTKNKSLNAIIDELNTIFNNICEETNKTFTDNDYISEDFLNNNRLHLNKRGTARIACKFRDFIKRNY